MISLPKRLNCIASTIEKSDIVLDVGCDHALLDIYLSFKYKKKYYASDLRESALNNARENIKKYNATNVVLRCSNGLEKIEENIDTIVISGMGYITIMNILKNIKKLTKIKKLVIQSNTNSEVVRKFILKNGFYLEKDLVVLDKNIYYIVSVFKRGHKYISKQDKELGLIEGVDLNKYLDYEIKKNSILYKLIPKKYILKRLNVKRKIKYLNIKKEILCK